MITGKNHRLLVKKSPIESKSLVRSKRTTVTSQEKNYNTDNHGSRSLYYTNLSQSLFYHNHNDVHTINKYDTITTISNIPDGPPLLRTDLVVRWCSRPANLEVFTYDMICLHGPSGMPGRVTIDKERTRLVVQNNNKVLFT